MHSIIHELTYFTDPNRGNVCCFRSTFGIGLYILAADEDFGQHGRKIKHMLVFCESSSLYSLFFFFSLTLVHFHHNHIIMPILTQVCEITLVTISVRCRIHDNDTFWSQMTSKIMLLAFFAQKALAKLLYLFLFTHIEILMFCY